MLQRIDSAQPVRAADRRPRDRRLRGAAQVAADRVGPQRPPGRAGGRRRRRLHLPRATSAPPWRGSPGAATAWSPPARPTGHRPPTGTYDSAVGLGTAWDSKWDIYGNDSLITPDRIHGGKIAAGYDPKHFVTSGLKSFKVIGPSSGEVAPHFGLGSNVLAYFPKTGPLPNVLAMYPQAFLTTARSTPRGWSTSATGRGRRRSPAPGAGSIPAESPGGSLLARVAVVVDEPDRPDPHALHHQAAEPQRLGDRQLWVRRHRPRPRPRRGAQVPVPDRRRQVEVGGGECRRLLQPGEGPPPHRLRVRRGFGRKPRSQDRQLPLSW